MKFLCNLDFHKNETTLPCRICELMPQELPMILEFQDRLYKEIENKETFVTLSKEEWEYLIANGFVMAVCPQNEPDRLAYIMGCVYPSDRENLGHDIGLAEQEISHVGHLEIAIADSDFRGYRMHSVMCGLCAERFEQDGRTRFIMSTVHPDNLPSRRALESAGLVSVMEKEKYGGKLRCIMLRRV